MLKQLIASAILLSISQLSYAGVIISAQAGKTFSHTLTTKEAKELKTKANKFVKELKDFCEPLEADGKKTHIVSVQGKVMKDFVENVQQV